jgi:hypothetical protein
LVPENIDKNRVKNVLPGSVHLAMGFQRRRLKCEKLMDDGCQVMAKAHIAFGNEINMESQGTMILLPFVNSQSL